MEVWTGDEEGNYKLFATYPICYFSGKLGPKLKEGDKQAPEGFYTVSLGQSRHKGRWPRSLNIGFPNPFDQINMRSGSHILIHGGCASVGCFAMTNAVNEEIHKLSTAALEAGQPHLHIHSFPFRMTDENMASHDMPQWHAFWQNLKEGYDLFERTKRPPRVSVCGDRYSFAAASRVEGVNTGSIVVCPDTAEVIASLRSINKRVAEQSTVVAGASTAEIKTASIVTPTSYFASAATTGVAANRLGENFELQLAPETPRKGVSETLTRPLPCSLALPSCRKYASLREQVAHKTALRAEEPERAKARAPKKKKKSSKKRNRRKSSNRQASAYDSGVREYREVVSAPSGRDWREVKMSSYQ